jgi:hypothetical protein
MYKIICDLTEDGLLVGTFTETTKSYREALDIVKYLRQFAGYEGFEIIDLEEWGF